MSVASKPELPINSQVPADLTADTAALIVSEAAAEKKAHEIVTLNVAGIIDITDRLVICSGSNDRQLKAISDEIRRRMRDEGLDILHQEGTPEGGWTLIDYGDVVVHIFSDTMRRFYDLERLWKDAPRLEHQSVAS